MKEIKKVALGVIAMALLLVAADWAVGSWSEMMYFSSKYDIFHRQIYCLNESNDEVLILGSSRAGHHYVPSIIEDSLGMSCFNAGSDGMCIYYHYAILASKIQSGRIPKIVILDIQESDVEKVEGAVFTLDAAIERLAPHYDDNVTIKSLYDQKSYLEHFKMLSKTYRYNSRLVQLILCNYFPTEDDKGFTGIVGCLDSIPEVEVASGEYRLNIDESKVACLKKLVDLCRLNSIKLITCYSPYYKHSENEAMSYIHNTMADNNVPFFNFCSDPIFANRQLFKDRDHLNIDGATIYTKLLLKDINVK